MSNENNVPSQIPYIKFLFSFVSSSMTLEQSSIHSLHIADLVATTSLATLSWCLSQKLQILILFSIIL